MRAKPVRKEERAGINFPIGRVARYLREGHYAPSIGVKGAVSLSAILEYIVFELLDTVIPIVKEDKMTRIMPRHIVKAVREDDDLREFYGKTNTVFGIKKGPKKRRVVGEEDGRRKNGDRRT